MEKLNNNNDDMVEIKALEDNLKATGTVTVLGAGRLGARVVMDLLEVHRGGFEKIQVFDGAKIDKNDIVHRKYGAKVGDFKTKFLEDYYPEKIIGIPKYVDVENIKDIEGDVIISVIAGGDTLKIRESVLDYALKNDKQFISTNGVFGIEKPVKVEMSQEAKGPVEFMKNMANHTVVGTGGLIKDGEPITPYTLDKMSELIVKTSLKLKK
ncbi:ThiF family adenylyltransferase [Methanococcus voltae]|uniref:Putative ThiF/HesA family dinucleotide-utilizing enzyme n=1 Tax=Methanococcus voltae TaxID=2188 RepID=A0A8J7S5V3_METVO|nr:ThiF family adenylyltransferase [Methanococcus voltae]MBP2173128.1 putative ThiF/HesA family dinucleotide-utilizing enzyme [Methanococcus voltae]MBP2202080.1 putative ThiF/HesA family dinucleotide-utilizing enzyme [Methanococcus voltae]